MFFFVFLMYEFPALVLGGTTAFPSKENLDTPTEIYLSSDQFLESTLIFRYSRNSTSFHLKNPVKVSNFREQFEEVLYENPSTRSTESRSRRETANTSESPQLHPKKESISSSVNTNPSSSEVFEGDEVKHISSTEEKDLHRGKGEGNTTASDDDHHHNHYEGYRDKKIDLETDDKVSHSFSSDLKSSLNHERAKKDEGRNIFEGSGAVFKTATDGKENSFEKLNGSQYEGNKDSIADKNASSNFLNKTKNLFYKTIIHPISANQNSSNSFVSSTLELNDSHSVNTANKPKDIFIGAIRENLKDNSTIVPFLKMTRKPKNKKIPIEKFNESLEMNYSLPTNNKRLEVNLNATSRMPMLQDEMYHAISTESSILLENTWFLTTLNRKKGNNNHNQRDMILKTSTLITTPMVTTPDSHMNDPPFRGPNVPHDIENTYKDKKGTKYDYNSHSTADTPAVIRNFGKSWKPSPKILGITWDCHYYVIGSLFFVTAFYSFISLLRINTFVTLLNTGYYVTINSLILLLCTLRVLYLFYDPYNLTGKYPTIISSILLKITLPFLTSSFCLLEFCLLKSTNTQFLSASFLRISVMAVIITFSISLFLCLEIAVFVFWAPVILIIAGNILITVWGIISSLSYFYVFKRLHQRALRKQGEMIRLTFTKMHIDGAQLPKKLPKPTLGLAVKLVMLSAILQLLLCISMPFDMIFSQSIFPSLAITDQWIWWGYHLACRILELLMCATMSFIATQPQKHYEIGDNRFCSILMWFPCSSFAECCRREEIIDFEAHSDNYANLQGIRNSQFNLTASSRRLQTNSLPTFRTPGGEVHKTLPMRTLPCTGRHTNHASAISLLSYYRSKRTLSISTNDGLEELERTLCNQTISSSDTRNTLRPASMLYKDNGFIRFRRENDPEQPMEMSDEDDHIQDDTSLEDAESTKANVGSSFHSLLEGDVVQNTLSPFFRIGYKNRFRKMSRVSIETTDYSADVSSDQLSNVVNLRNGLSTSALDFNVRKYGSTCSSESAANSFDVTFFLNSTSSPEMQTSPTSTTPASFNVGSAYRSETEDDKTSSVEGHEVMLRSVSPIVKRASSGRLSLNLNLHAAADSSHSSGHVNVACGTEDITPDSAVYLDLHLSRENTINFKNSPETFTSLEAPGSVPIKSSIECTDKILHEELSEKSSFFVFRSKESQGELRTSNSYVHIPKVKRQQKGLLYKLCGSTFSLNASIYGYEPLEQVDYSKNSSTEGGRRKLERSSSDRRPLSEGQLDVEPKMTLLGEFRNRTIGTGSGFLGDSGMLGDCGIALVDVASQTEDSEINACNHKACPLLTKQSHKLQSHPSLPLVDIRK